MPSKKKPSPKRGAPPQLSPAIWRQVRTMESQSLYIMTMLELEPHFLDDLPTGEEVGVRSFHVLYLCRQLRRLTGAPELRIQAAIRAAIRRHQAAKLDAELSEPEE